MVEPPAVGHATDLGRPVERVRRARNVARGERVHADHEVEPAPESELRREKPRKEKRRKVTAESMAAKQRDISVSEFFAKNRHLLGFDNPRKALLTTVKEAVDNSLDACEEAGIVPEIWVVVESTGNNRFKVSVQDNGPGILKKQIPLIFGKLLYGSKFHRLRMSRGQQGIGISAAGMYGQLTTGKPIRIISRTSDRKPANLFDVQIDTKKNEPIIVKKSEIEWEHARGTQVSIELEGKYQKGRASVDEYAFHPFTVEKQKSSPNPSDLGMICIYELIMVLASL